MDGLSIIPCILPLLFHFPLLRVHALYGVPVSYVVWILGWRGSGVFSVPWMHVNGVFFFPSFLDGKGAVKIEHDFIMVKFLTLI